MKVTRVLMLVQSALFAFEAVLIVANRSDVSPRAFFWDVASAPTLAVTLFVLSVFLWRLIIMEVVLAIVLVAVEVSLAGFGILVLAGRLFIAVPTWLLVVDTIVAVLVAVAIPVGTHRHGPVADTP